MRAELEPAYILHARPFRDTSVIFDCLTENHGRISLLGKGVRSAKSKRRQLCQPFIPLLLSWQGKSQLKTLTDIESRATAPNLIGQYLFSGFYLNELLTRALPEHDPCREIFLRYQWALYQLSDQPPLEPLLREIELGLLQDLGYSINLGIDASSGKPINSDQWYRYVPELGLVLNAAPGEGGLYLGKHILALAKSDFSDIETLRQSKQLLRNLLKPIIGQKPLKSRELFMTNNTPRAT